MVGVKIEIYGATRAEKRKKTTLSRQIVTLAEAAAAVAAGTALLPAAVTATATAVAADHLLYPLRSPLRGVELKIIESYGV